MEVRIYENAQQVGVATAMLIAAQVTKKPDSVLGLATGSSPIGCYQQLIKWYNEGVLDFSRCVSYNLDEYCGIPEDHICSYHDFMNKNLFDFINMNEHHVPNGNAPDLQAECKRYDAAIEKAGGIDLQLLGIGNNGHIAFNEPNKHFVYGTQIVKLTDSTIDANQRFFEKREDVPTHAYTMGIGSIMKAKRVLLVCNGAGKAQAVKDCFFGPIKPQAPGSILQLHPDFTLVADEAALSLVKDLI